jgi:hypothetical protein
VLSSGFLPFGRTFLTSFYGTNRTKFFIKCLTQPGADTIKFGNFALKKPYQDLMSEPDLPLPGTSRCNHKIESMIGAEIVKIVSMDVYACGERCSQPVGTNIVKISEANYRDNPDLCIKTVFEALLSLPAGFYTVVYHTEPLPCVMDFRVSDKGFGLRVRPLDRETNNDIKRPACLRIEIE